MDNFSVLLFELLGSWLSALSTPDVTSKSQPHECLWNVWAAQFAPRCSHRSFLPLFCLLTEMSDESLNVSLHRSLSTKTGHGTKWFQNFFQLQNYMVLRFFNGSKIQVRVSLPFLWCFIVSKHLHPAAAYPPFLLFKVHQQFFFSRSLMSLPFVCNAFSAQWARLLCLSSDSCANLAINYGAQISGAHPDRWL